MAEQTEELPADLMEVLRCPLTRSRLRQEGQWLIGELGGLRYPIRDGFPVLLVCRASLGTINHTLLSLREIERSQLPLAGIVMNVTHPQDADTARAARGDREGNLSVASA